MLTALACNFAPVLALWNAGFSRQQPDLAFISAPVFALSVVDLIGQAVVTLIVVALYHAWQSGRKPAEPPRSAPTEPMPAAKPAAAVVVTPVAISTVTASAPPVPAPAAKSVDALAPELAAVIAAAIAVVLDRPHRVLAVQQAFMPTPHLNVWALEGRVQILGSHKIR